MAKNPPPGDGHRMRSDMSSGRAHSLVDFVVGAGIAAHENSRSGDSPLGMLASGGFAAFAT